MVFFQQVGAVAGGYGERLFLPPGFDIAVVAAEQHWGRRTAPPYLWTGVLGVFQQAGKVALVGEAGLFGKHTGQHAAYGVG